MKFSIFSKHCLVPFFVYGIIGVFIAIVLWNTMYLERALEYLQSQGSRVEPEDVARLSPLQHAHINVLGCHQFLLSEPLKRGEYRPLHEQRVFDNAVMSKDWS